jgi:hypothetical protein
VSLLVSEPLSWSDSLQPIQIDRRMSRDDRTVLRTSGSVGGNQRSSSAFESPENMNVPWV